MTAIIDVDESRAKALATDVGALNAGATLSGRGYRASTGGSTCGAAVMHATTLDEVTLANADAVYIGTTPSTHADLVRTALAADKHVLLEKPLAASRADAAAIVAAADDAATRGLHVGMNIGMRWNAALVRMRALAVEAPGRSVPASARLDMHYVQWPREWQVQPWCAARAEGGPLREVGTHFLAALLELFGPASVARVRCAISYPDGPDGTKAESACDGHLELTSGLRVSLSVRTDGTGLAADGEDHYQLELSWPEGGDAAQGGATESLLLDGFVDLYQTRQRKRKRLVKGTSYGRKECVEALVAAAVARRAEGGGGADGGAAAQPSSSPLPHGGVTVRTGRNVQRVLDALLASGGEWVVVDYSDDE